MANSTKTEHRAFIAMLGLFMVLVCALLYPFFNAIVLSIVFVVLFQPVHSLYLKWTKGHANVAAFLSVVSVVLFLLLPLAVFLALLASQLAEFAAPQNPTTEPTVSTFLQSFQQKASYLGGQLERFFGLSLDLVPLIRREMAQLGQTLAKYSPQVIASTANFFMQFFVMLILLFYLFRDGGQFILALIRITPVKDRYERKLASEIQKIINGVFYGTFVTALIQGILGVAGFFAIGVEGYFVWGVLTFFASFIPTIGTGAVTVPLFVSLLLQGKTTRAFLLLGYAIVIISGVDNFLRPYLMRSSIHPMLLFLGMFGGLVVFGPIGLLLGALFMSLLIATLRMYAEDFVGVTLPTAKPEKH